MVEHSTVNRMVAGSSPASGATNYLMKEKRLAPTTLVVLGVSGDLMARKLAPALLKLFSDGNCPAGFKIVGFSRRDWTDEDLRTHIKSQLAKHSSEASASEVNQFLKLLSYCQGNFDDAQAYQDLSAHLQKVEGQSKPANRLFYLAVPPQLYTNIIGRLDKSGLMRPPPGGWARLIIEKPFGNSLEQAAAVDKLLNDSFSEDQVYRIDHYLAKEAVQNILTFRFANNFLSAAWNKQFIERIDIRLLEKIDIEGRGQFYDATGALLDVGQNHLLQMLALVTMDQPPTQSAEEIRRGRATILEHLIPLKDVAQQTVRAQYSGYLKEPEVSPSSKTETYFKIKTAVELPNWRGVPVYLEAGKKMPAVDKQIIISFRHPRPCLCPPERHYRNQLFIRIQPNPGIEVSFFSKQPGSKSALEEQALRFAYPMGETARYKQEYAQALLDAINGDLTLFVSSQEALAAWRFIDPIIRAWRAKDKKLPSYAGASSITKIAESLERPAGQLKHQLGLVGLGKMGRNMALRLSEQGWAVTALTRQTEDPQIEALHDVQKFVARLAPRRLIWLMVPADNVDEVLFGDSGLVKHLEPGDTIIDGGNSYFGDSKARATKLAKLDLGFMDVGVSGGPAGARRGAALMIGGPPADFEKFEELFAALAAPGAYQFFAGAGAGHFVKMVHNGIEYGMMQAIAEGFTILKHSDYKLDLTRVAEVYNNGSVIQSRLVGWLESAFELYGQDLSAVSGKVGQTGEGAWTVQTAQQMNLKAKVIEDALEFRELSAQAPDYTGQILSALRNQFGGHDIH